MDSNGSKEGSGLKRRRVGDECLEKRAKTAVLSNLPSTSAIQASIEAAKAKILASRRSETSTGSLGDATTTSATVAPSNGLSEIKAAIAAAQARIASKFGTTTPSARPAKILLDSSGNIVDESGRRVQMTKRAPATKVNIEYQRAQSSAKFEVVSAADLLKDVRSTKSSFYDPTIGAATFERKSRKLKFVPTGTYAKRGENMRTRALSEATKAQLSKESAVEKEETELPSIRPVDVPDCHWWDKPLLGAEKRSEIITHLIHHPAIPPNIAKTYKEEHAMEVKMGALPLMLTKVEQKKLRHMTRINREKEKQVKIKLGLIPAPPPKVKVSNMMRVLTAQAVMDPTAIEVKVREEMDRRKAEHDEANLAKKLTAEQRREKKAQKLDEDAEKGISCVVFRIENLASPKHKYKIDMNAKQLKLSGCVLLRDIENSPKSVNSQFSLVVAEGGARAMSRFTRLMEHRIKWEGSTDDDDDEQGTKCSIVWRGSLPGRSFRFFRFQSIVENEDGLSFLRRFGLQHYFEAAQNFVAVSDAV